MTVPFAAGHRVAIINVDYNGSIVFEGWAEITKILDSNADGTICRARVRFLRSAKDRKGGKFLPGIYERNVHSRWQTDPEQFAEDVNAERREHAERTKRIHTRLQSVAGI